MTTYVDIGATFGTNENRTYGTLFDSALPNPTASQVLFARVEQSDVFAEVTTLPVLARSTTLNSEVLTEVTTLAVLARSTTLNIDVSIN